MPECTDLHITGTKKENIFLVAGGSAPRPPKGEGSGTRGIGGEEEGRGGERGRRGWTRERRGKEKVEGKGKGMGFNPPNI
jgi:hypothetical protein